MTINIWLTYIVGGVFLLLLGAVAVLLVLNANERAVIASDDAAKSMLQAQNDDWAQKAARADVAFAQIKAADTANARAIAKAETAAATAGKKLQAEAAFIGGFSYTGTECDEVMEVKQAYMEHLQ